MFLNYCVMFHTYILYLNPFLNLNSYYMLSSRPRRFLKTDSPLRSCPQHLLQETSPSRPISHFPGPLMFWIIFFPLSC